jgi:hypothetical protein
LRTGNAIGTEDSEVMEDFGCKSVRRSMWDYVAGGLDDVDRHAVGYHVQDCRDCELHRKEVRSLRSGLKNLPPMHVPAMLNTRLRVIASRERSRRLARRDFQTWLKDQKSRARLFVDNLLKPFAVPAAGGILASFMCFGVIVDTLHVVPEWQKELPIGISTEVAFDDISPFSCGHKDVLVQLSVDSDGKVTDWKLHDAADASPEEIQEIGNLVLYSTFTPAVRSGWPVSSKRLVFMSHINVRG